MNKFFKIYLINFAVLTQMLLNLSCSNSSQPLVEGYTLIGSVLDSCTNKGIDSVKIFTSTVNQDSPNFVFTGIITDSLGKFIFHISQGTGPSDEILLFTHQNYITKEIELKYLAQKVRNYTYDIEVFLNPIDTSNASPKHLVGLQFNTYIHSRFFFINNPKNPLVVLYNKEQEEQFLDTTEAINSSFYFPHYEDSLLIVLRSPYKVSVSNNFSIDSLVPDTLNNIITIHAHNYFPINKMSVMSTHCHIISIPKMNAEFTYEIKEIFETTDGVILSFLSFSKGNYSSYSGEVPFLVTLNNKSQQDSFMNQITIYGDFPEFDYSDSMLVGVFSKQFNHVTPFEIVSLIQFDNIIKVSSQYYYVGMLPSAEVYYHLYV